MSTFFKKYNVIKKFCGFNHKTFYQLLSDNNFYQITINMERSASVTCI